MIAKSNFDPVTILDPKRTQKPPVQNRGGAMLTRMSDVTPRPIQWLWPGWIALGKIAIIDGDPGLGKSLATLDIAARVSTGRAMPGDCRGELYAIPSGVLLLTAEDDPADTLRPRLDAARADVTRIVALEGVSTPDGERMPRLSDLDAIAQSIREVKARLVVIDPVMAYLGGDAHRDNEVRQSLGPIAKLLAEHHAAGLVVRHLNKSGGSHAVYRGGGSIAIIGAARTGMLVARDPDDDTARVLAATKSNLAELPESFGYRVTPSGGTARVEWTGTSTHNATSLLAAEGAEPVEPTAADECAEWLRSELAPGPRRTSDLKRDARAAGFSWRTVERAKSSVNVSARRANAGGTRGAGAWIWAMPGDARDLGEEDDHDD